MWQDVFPDPWASRFPLGRNHFKSSGGFYGERPFTFGEYPVYFPFLKMRRSPGGKKTRLVENLSSEAKNICCEAREDPSTNDSHLKVKEEDQSSKLKLSQPVDDNFVKTEPVNDEDVLGEKCDKTFDDASQEFVKKKVGLEQKDIFLDQSDDNNRTSRANAGAGSLKESSSRQSEAKITEDLKLNEIGTQLLRAQELVPRVMKFEGSREDKEYLYLEEHLTRLILALDLINADGLENVKLARKSAVKEILNIITDLEARVSA
ncbi:uncharacterized protein [Montipora capricornis]|uniref:uncharacterized protein n=1 Tax=Montipora capricornis TaxID=246305 RepID=UPI0035F1E406